MSLHAQLTLLDVRAAGVTAARLNAKSFDQANARAVGDELSRLADAAGAGELHLDLAPLERLSSAGLGKLLLLYKKVRAAGGKLSLHNARPAVYGVFAVTRLTGLFNVRPHEGAACQCA